MIYIIIVCRETGNSRMISFESRVGWSLNYLSSFLCMNIIFQLANYDSILFITNTCSKLWNDFCNCWCHTYRNYYNMVIKIVFWYHSEISPWRMEFVLLLIIVLFISEAWLFDTQPLMNLIVNHRSIYMIALYLANNYTNNGQQLGTVY